jgi:hypothetical protein
VTSMNLMNCLGGAGWFRSNAILRAGQSLGVSAKLKRNSNSWESWQGSNSSQTTGCILRAFARMVYTVDK